MNRFEDASPDIIEALLDTVKKLQKKYPTVKVFFQGEGDRYRRGELVKTTGNQNINVLTIGLDKKGKPKAGHMMRREYNYLKDPEASTAIAEKDLEKFKKSITEDILAKMNGQPTTKKIIVKQKEKIIDTPPPAATKKIIVKQKEKIIDTPAATKKIILKQKPAAPKKKKNPLPKGLNPDNLSVEQMREYILKQSVEDVREAEIQYDPTTYQSGNKLARMINENGKFSERIRKGMKGYTKEQVEGVYSFLLIMG